MRDPKQIPNFFAVTASLTLRAIGFAILWWVLAEGRMEDAWFITLCVGAALAASIRFWPPGAGAWRPIGILGFIPFFLMRSVQGGTDVARRAFQPSMPLRPEILVCKLDGSERQTILLAWIVSLLPGTASVRLTDKALHVHVLDSSMRIEEKIRELERRVAAICD